MQRTVRSLTVALCLTLFCSTALWAHCEIPCGIYDDEMRIKMIAEHLTTIEKSMKEIAALSKSPQVHYNQLIRWVTNKEHHADEIQHIVAQYFMTQRIKPDSFQVMEKLTLLHKMLVGAMKCKQETDVGHVKTMRELLDQFKTLYFAPAPQPGGGK